MNNSVNNTSDMDKSVEEPIDAIIKISISKNKLEASVNIEPPKHGGAGPDIQSLREAIANKDITYGVDAKKLLQICKDPIYNQDIIFARGISPVNGVDGSYEILFQTEKDLKPKVREDGTVDFRDLEMIENVEKDQVLSTITLAKQGKDGVSVTREKIPYIKGKPAPLLAGKNTKLNDDGTAVLAVIDGQVDFNRGKINVNETLFIKDNVDNSTGNIKAAGNVTINGSILPGFIVEADGNIQVNGGVSSATLIAGGSIVLRNGIIGGKISCEGDLTSRFIENSNVFVKGNIKTDYVMNSDVKCGEDLQTTSAISKIVGGTYLVGGNIEARIIGSIADVNTHLELGTDPAIIAKQQEIIKELPDLETKIESLEPLITLLRQFERAERLTPDKKKVLDDALFSYKETIEAIESKKLELEEITTSIHSKGYGRITCTDTIFPGTTVKISSARMKVYDPMYGKSLYYSNASIHTGTAK